MQPGARRRARNNNNGVLLNSPPKLVKTEHEPKTPKKLRRNQSDSNVEKDKSRRTWKPPETNSKSPVLLKAASDLSNSPKICHEVVKEEEVDDDEIEIEGVIINNFDDKEIDLPIQPIGDLDMVIYHEEIKPELRILEEEKMEQEKMEEEYNSENRMQNIVDLVMWRDVSKSCFVFGFGTFMLLSSSYAKDLNFSIISAISYVGLVYLALIFFYRSILTRGEVEYEEENEAKCLIREEDVICILRILLPYINEVIVNIKALFSGGPQTTIKLAVILFVMARCGNSITMWTLCKLLFFGVFTIPKVLSSYSIQLARYGKFWIERFGDAWKTCTQKKAVAASVFIFVWNVSSTDARVWIVFIFIVGVKLYNQQYGMDWLEAKGTEDILVESENVEAIISCISSEVTTKGKNMAIEKDTEKITEDERLNK